MVEELAFYLFLDLVFLAEIVQGNCGGNGEFRVDFGLDLVPKFLVQRFLGMFLLCLLLTQELVFLFGVLRLKEGGENRMGDHIDLTHLLIKSIVYSLLIFFHLFSVEFEIHEDRVDSFHLKIKVIVLILDLFFADFDLDCQHF